MAYPQVGPSIPAKMSFAKIAAMPAPNMIPALPNIHKENKPRNAGGVASAPLVGGSSSLQNVPAANTIQASNHPESQKENMEKLAVAIEGLALVQDDSSRLHASKSTNSGDSIGDDQSQLSTSSLKQQSFDTKSMASTTTFAMDEKESIRPDDSASVRAVEEDDHPGLSRNSSFQQEAEVAVHMSRAARQTLVPNVIIPARRPPSTMIHSLRFGDLPVGPVSEAREVRSSVSESSSIQGMDENRTRPPALPVTPDEKLLEALASPKDRLALLQLEEKLMFFVTSTGEDMLELPPQNAFARLLTHKLADYYNLAHQLNEDTSSVRISRTTCSSLPTPLAEFAKSIPTGSQHLTNAAQVKIMRRAQIGPRQFSVASTTASSSVPSKAASENGGEANSEEGLLSPLDSTPNRDRSKLTREEREAQYKAARERIFGDFQESVTSESGSAGETSASMSRSSSSSGKKKSRKQKNFRDDGFEARSAFIPSYYGAMNMQPTYQSSYNEIPYSGVYSGSSGNYAPPVYGTTPTQIYPGYDTNMVFGNPGGFVAGGGQPYAGNDNWQNMQQPVQGTYYNMPYQQPVQMMPQMNNQYAQNSGQSMSQSPAWSQNQYQNTFSPPISNLNNAQWPKVNTHDNVRGSTPYQYGQLPVQGMSNAMPYGSQHPVPGSYSSTRSLFNPQTRSFVPNNNNNGRGGRNNRKKSGQSFSHNRSGDTSGAGSPALTISDRPSPKPREESLQLKYGTPANLPKKPPPSQVSSTFSVDTPGSPNANGNAGSGPGGPLVVNGSRKTS